MKTTRPNIQRVYLTVRDALSGQSKSFTLYEAGFDATVSWIKDLIERETNAKEDGTHATANEADLAI